MKRLLLIILSVLAFSMPAWAVVNINTANQADLESVKGIGPKKAQAIIEYRKQTPFKSVDDLDNVKGFGKKTIDHIRSEVSVTGPANTTSAKAAPAKAAPAKPAAPAKAAPAAPAKKTDKK